MTDLKPGQKFPTPTPGFGDRVFYESLLRQRPESAMAQEWCVHYGVLTHKEAERLNKIVLERKRNNRLGISSSQSTSSSPPPKKKKKPVKIVKDEAINDPDVVASSGDGIGLASL